MLPVAKPELRAARDSLGARIAPGGGRAAGCDGEVAARAKHGCAAREQLIAVPMVVCGGEDQLGAARRVSGDTRWKLAPLPEEVACVRRQQLR